MIRILTTMFALAAGTSPAFCDDELFDGKIRPLDRLPEHVTAPAGKLTLFADYKNKTDQHRVPVYLVNRTDKPITVEAQDGDIYMKLQYESAPGHWQRAETHVFSTCGNSYMPKPPVTPESYFVTAGWMPTIGKPETVRYSLYNQKFELSSNAGPGIVNRNAVERATLDEMALRAGDFEFLSKVATGKLNKSSYNERERYDPRSRAILLLRYRWKEKQQAVAVLEAIVKDADQKYADVAAKTLKSLVPNRQPPE